MLIFEDSFMFAKIGYILCYLMVIIEIKKNEKEVKQKRCGMLNV